jgi:hypothetical protein
LICFCLSLLTFPNDFSTNGEGFTGVSALSLRNAALATEYRRIIYIKGVSLFYQISNEPSITIFGHRNIFAVTFASF